MAHSNDDAADSLLAVAARFKLTFPATRAGYDVLPWRYGHMRPGSLPAFDLNVKLLATNGVVAWFAKGDDTPFWGHLSNFVPDAAEPAVRSGKRAPSAKATRLAQMMSEI